MIGLRADALDKWTDQRILDILAKHRDELRALGVRKLGLFGSYLRGNPTSGSDIDLLVTLDNSSFDAYMDVKFLLEDLFQCKVDLVLEKTLKPRLRPYVLTEVKYPPGL